MHLNGFEFIEGINGHQGDASPGMQDMHCSSAVAALRVRPMITGDPIFLGESDLDHFKKKNR
jgi:hypothetical protein